jgi:hypothetical protein
VPTDLAGWRALRVALLGAAAGLLLVGCGNAAPSGNAAPTAGGDPSSTPASAHASVRTTATAPSARANHTDSPSGGAASADPGAVPSAEVAAAEPAAESGDDRAPGVEMPEAPEQEAVSLADLLEGVRTAPLASAPLPRAAGARGRLVTGFPSFLRPTRSSRVETSSVSPAGSRLQVALVGSTSLRPGDVLLAYRLRLAGRGLAEQASPAAPAGSEAAAFRRGPSTVTVAVTPQGSGTHYSVLASLHTGGG